MLCDSCKKREATVHIKQVHNGQCETSNLCSECARELEKNGMLEIGFNLAEVLTNLKNFTDSPAAEIPSGVRERKESTLECPGCGWTVEKLRSSGGKLGCPKCYRVFAPLVGEMISRVQRGEIHLGKRPSAGEDSGNAIKAELEKLRKEIEMAVSVEEYERAAVCRDRIAQLKEKLRKLEEGDDEKKKKPAARKPAARKPAVKKPAAGKPAAKPAKKDETQGPEVK